MNNKRNHFADVGKMIKAEKATIYDFARMCNKMGTCCDCPMGHKMCNLRAMNKDTLDKANEIILKWCKEHPINTRQSEFLKMFPNAPLVDEVINICPNIIDIQYNVDCDEFSCEQCKKSYWLAEVDENDTK